MRWLLQWFLDDLRRLFNPHVGELHRIREAMTRARRRQAHHRAASREASERAGELLRRVRALEISDEAAVGDLVAARRELVVAEGDMRHHRARLTRTEEAVRLMKVDRDRMQSGEEPLHRDEYLELLNR